jgi:predicted GIY-YIG superfamily endonuclease
MDHVVQVMTTSQNQTSPILRPFKYLPYNLRHCCIPQDTNGYTYCIMSLKTFSHTYIGTTHDLSDRLIQHNSTIGGAYATRNPELKPWVCIGFAVHFDDPKISRMRFEKQWQERRNSSGHNTNNPWQVLLIGMKLVDEWNRLYGTHLIFIQCIELKSHVDATINEYIS